MRKGRKITTMVHLTRHVHFAENALNTQLIRQEYIRL